VDLNLLIVGLSILLGLFILSYLKNPFVSFNVYLKDYSKEFYSNLKENKKRVIVDSIYKNAIFIPISVYGKEYTINTLPYYDREEKIAKNYKEITKKEMYFYHFLDKDCLTYVSKYYKENYGIDIDAYSLFSLFKNYVSSRYSYVKFDLKVGKYYKINGGNIILKVKIETPWLYLDERKKCYEEVLIVVKR